MTPAQLCMATGARLDRAIIFLPYLESAMLEFDIDTAQRKAMFLSQVGHESGGLRWTVELWGPTPAQARYEGREDLGNIHPGDGFKFRGRGLLQTTGLTNYVLTGFALNIDLLADPDLLSQPELASRSAAWFWRTNGLNAIADTGNDIVATKRINGGENGLQERQALYEAALRVFA